MPPLSKRFNGCSDVGPENENGPRPKKGEDHDPGGKGTGESRIAVLTNGTGTTNRAACVEGGGAFRREYLYP